MKILIVHNRYLSLGGEDTVVNAEKQLLENNGHQVVTYFQSNSRIEKFSGLQKVTYALTDAYWSQESYRAIKQLIANERPDLAHFHNTFYVISPSAYQACFNLEVPVVQSIHNYRFLCPVGTFYRDNQICEDCLTKGMKSAVINKCWKDSHLASGLLVGILRSMEKNNIYQRINHFIVSSEFSWEKFVSQGFSPDKISVKPNFMGKDLGRPLDKREEYALFVGTLRSYKGIKTLLKAWQVLDRKFPLKVVGDGPLRPEVEAHSKNLPIEVLGQKTAPELFDLLKKAQFLIVPSECYETFSMVTMEAYACGTPVIASRIGALKDIVEEGRTGLFFESGNEKDLAQKIEQLINDRTKVREMGRNARIKFENKYTADANYDLLMKVYQKALAGSNKSSQESIRQQIKNDEIEH